VVEVPKSGIYGLTMRAAVVNFEQSIEVAVGAGEPVSVGVPNTHGLWGTTPEVDVRLEKGTQTLTLTRPPSPDAPAFAKGTRAAVLRIESEEIAHLSWRHVAPGNLPNAAKPQPNRRTDLWSVATRRTDLWSVATRRTDLWSVATKWRRPTTPDFPPAGRPERATSAAAGTSVAGHTLVSLQGVCTLLPRCAAAARISATLFRATDRCSSSARHRAIGARRLGLGSAATRLRCPRAPGRRATRRTACR